MRILVLHSRYASDAVSGENRVVDDEVQLLRSGEHDVEVWSPAVGEGGVSAMVRIGGRAIWSRSAAATVRDIVEEFEADVVHCHNLYPMLSPSVIRGAGRVPVVVTLHNYRLMCLSATLLRNGRCVRHASVTHPGPALPTGVTAGRFSQAERSPRRLRFIVPPGRSVGCRSIWP